MADQLQLRGGTTAQHATFTGALREVTVDTDKKTVVVHDGSTAGGNPLLRQDLSNLPAGTIDNADINASAGIVDTKLATIATAGKVSNSATTATNANTASAIVARDGSGNFTAGTITAALTGAASSNVLKAGDTMTGNLTVPSLNGGPLAGTRNRIINGDMRIDQRGAVVTTNGAYTADRWQLGFATSGAVQSAQSGDAPTGFGNSLLFDVTTADTSIAAGEYGVLSQYIEGLNTSDLAWGTASAQTVTLSFWVKSTTTGTYCVSFRNSGNSRSYVATYSVASANTWEYKTITVSGDTSGTWLGTNVVGISIAFCFAVGSTFQTTAGAWQAGNFLGTSAQTNLLASTANEIRITGVQLETGSTATPFERRSYGQELALCQRYFQLLQHSYGAANGINSIARCTWPLKVTMRAGMTLAAIGTPTWFFGGGTATYSSIGTNYSIPEMAQADMNIAGGSSTLGLCFSSASGGSGYFTASAEL